MERPSTSRVVLLVRVWFTDASIKSQPCRCYLHVQSGRLSPIWNCVAVHETRIEMPVCYLHSCFTQINRFSFLRIPPLFLSLLFLAFLLLVVSLFGLIFFSARSYVFYSVPHSFSDFFLVLPSIPFRARSSMSFFFPSTYSWFLRSCLMFVRSTFFFFFIIIMGQHNGH
jgi:hypothetical protein